MKMDWHFIFNKYYRAIHLFSLHLAQELSMFRCAAPSFYLITSRFLSIFRGAAPIGIAFIYEWCQVQSTASFIALKRMEKIERYNVPKRVRII